LGHSLGSEVRQQINQFNPEPTGPASITLAWQQGCGAGAAPDQVRAGVAIKINGSGAGSKTQNGRYSSEK